MIDCRPRSTRADYDAFDAREEALRDEGRREMLWLLVWGATVAVWQFGDRLRHPFTDDSIRPHFDHAHRARWMREMASEALADLGDERAREMRG